MRRCTLYPDKATSCARSYYAIFFRWCNGYMCMWSACLGSFKTMFLGIFGTDGIPISSAGMLFYFFSILVVWDLFLFSELWIFHTVGFTLRIQWIFLCMKLDKKWSGICVLSSLGWMFLNRFNWSLVYIFELYHYVILQRNVIEHYFIGLSFAIFTEGVLCVSESWAFSLLHCVVVCQWYLTWIVLPWCVVILPGCSHQLWRLRVICHDAGQVFSLACFLHQLVAL